MSHKNVVDKNYKMWYTAFTINTERQLIRLKGDFMAYLITVTKENREGFTVGYKSYELSDSQYDLIRKEIRDQHGTLKAYDKHTEVYTTPYVKFDVFKDETRKKYIIEKVKRG